MAGSYQILNNSTIWPIDFSYMRFLGSKNIISPSIGYGFGKFSDPYVKKHLSVDVPFNEGKMSTRFGLTYYRNILSKKNRFTVWLKCGVSSYRCKHYFDFSHAGSNRETREYISYYKNVNVGLVFYFTVGHLCYNPSLSC